VKTSLLLCVLLVLSCSKDKREKAEPKTDDRVDQVLALYNDLVARAEQIRDPETGWLDRDGCDGMIWAGVYAAQVDGVDIEAAEFRGEPGRFGRRPPPPCWDPVTGDQGSKTTWSRDMFVAGLAVWAWHRERLDVLERHAAYGKANNWQMGEPLDDGRTLYTPAMIGLLYQMIYALGGENSANRLWPSTYPSGLTDYQAHLQVKSIYLRGEIAGQVGDADAVPANPGDKALHLLSVSETMYQRIEEHYQREPSDPFYSFVWGCYSGDMSPAIDALLNGTVGTYVRCSQQEECELAHRIFVAGQLLEKFNGIH
jgi:hypothetical protein